VTLAIRYLIPQQLNFKGLSQDGGGGGEEFAENLRAYPFNKDLSKEATFSQIYVAGQYL
jgi:hypothetical protein